MLSSYNWRWLIENLLRSIPENLTLNIDLSKIKTTKIFKWLKK